MWTIFKVFTELITILFLLYILVFWPEGMWDLMPPTRDWTCAPCNGRWSLTNRPPRKSLHPLFDCLLYPSPTHPQQTPAELAEPSTVTPSSAHTICLWGSQSLDRRAGSHSWAKALARPCRPLILVSNSVLISLSIKWKKYCLGRAHYMTAFRPWREQPSGRVGEAPRC